MSQKCTVCGKTVYPLERQVVGKDKVCHKFCFKCLVCKRTLNAGSFYLSGDDVLCQKHFTERKKDPDYERKQEEKRQKEAEEQRQLAEKLRKEEEEKDKIRKAKQLREREREKRVQDMLADLENYQPSTSNEKAKNTEQEEKIGWQLSATRFLTTLSLDKPIYSTEDTICARGHFFNAHSLVAISAQTLSAMNKRFLFEILNAERSVVRI